MCRALLLEYDLLLWIVCCYIFILWRGSIDWHETLRAWQISSRAMIAFTYFFLVLFQCYHHWNDGYVTLLVVLTCFPSTCCALVKIRSELRQRRCALCIFCTRCLSIGDLLQIHLTSVARCAWPNDLFNNIFSHFTLSAILPQGCRNSSLAQIMQVWLASAQFSC